MSDLLVLQPPSGPLDCTIRVPGSKSVANRALICAFLASSTSVLSGLPDGDDTEALLGVIGTSGALQSRHDDRATVSPGHLDNLPSRVDARLAGTTSRFLTAVAALCSHPVEIDGAGPLRRRPMAPLHDALRLLGAQVDPVAQPGFLPVRVGGRAPGGGRLTMRGDVSSQFISSLMLIGPMLDGGLTIDIEGPLVSRSYVELTCRVMESFGVFATVSEEKVVVRPGRYRGIPFSVEPDFSSASVPVCAVLVRGGTVRIPGLSWSLGQADARVLEIAESMGARVSQEGHAIVVSRDGSARPRPVTIDMSNCSDLVPVVAAACAVADGISDLSGIGFIRAKESDRLSDLAGELRRLGASIEVTDDGLTVHGVPRLAPAVVETHHDHRLAMAFSVAALSAGSVTISDPGVVSKSWPSFYKDMDAVFGS